MCFTSCYCPTCLTCSQPSRLRCWSCGQRTQHGEGPETEILFLHRTRPCRALSQSSSVGRYCMATWWGPGMYSYSGSGEGGGGCYIITTKLINNFFAQVLWPTKDKKLLKKFMHLSFLFKVIVWARFWPCFKLPKQKIQPFSLFIFIY